MPIQANGTQGGNHNILPSGNIPLTIVDGPSNTATVTFGKIKKCDGKEDPSVQFTATKSGNTYTLAKHSTYNIDGSFDKDNNGNISNGTLTRDSHATKSHGHCPDPNDTATFSGTTP